MCNDTDYWQRWIFGASGCPNLKHKNLCNSHFLRQILLGEERCKSFTVRFSFCTVCISYCNASDVCMRWWTHLLGILYVSSPDDTCVPSTCLYTIVLLIFLSYFMMLPSCEASFFEVILLFEVYLLHFSDVK